MGKILTSSLIMELPPSVTPEMLFPDSFAQATSLQKELASRVIKENQLQEVHRVTGFDVSHSLKEPNKIFASGVTIDAYSRQRMECKGACKLTTIPYRPGFLGFREVPALLSCWQQLTHAPQLIFVDGHGISHPRGLGIASHLGVLLDIPSIGVAKSLLIGKLEAPLGPNPGDQVHVLWKNEVVAIALRTKVRSNPIFISIGHRIDLPSAVDWVWRLCQGYRLPEPTRLAHKHANAFRTSLASNPLST